MSYIVTGRVVDMDAYGYLVRIPHGQIRPDVSHLGEECPVQFRDHEDKTWQQVKKCWAIMNDIAKHAGYRPDEVEEYIHHPLREKFTLDVFKTLEHRLFRLSYATKSEASQYIEFLLNFALEHNVPLSEAPTANLSTDEIIKYEHCCAVNRKCAVCMADGAVIHHIDKVGMGNDRHSINHIGLRCLPLCGKHHDEVHRRGQKEFLALYHLEPLTIDQTIVKAHKQLQTKENQT